MLPLLDPLPRFRYLELRALILAAEQARALPLVITRDTLPKRSKCVVRDFQSPPRRAGCRHSWSHSAFRTLGTRRQGTFGWMQVPREPHQKHTGIRICVRSTIPDSNCQITLGRCHQLATNWRRQAIAAGVAALHWQCKWKRSGRNPLESRRGQRLLAPRRLFFASV